MRTLKFLTICFSMIFLCSCGAFMEKMKEMQEKSAKIQEVATSVCSNCDVVRLLNYKIENLTTIVELEVVGTGEVAGNEVASNMNEVFKKEVEGYCEIDIVAINVINKGQQETFVIKKCTLQEKTQD